MARKDALLRLHQRLLTQRDDLRRKLGLHVDASSSAGTGTSDVGDIAFDGAEKEINSQLAALETRELRKIERAIEAIREGRYGKCELCGRSIPITRLRALPYTPSCVECQRKQEESGEDFESGIADWESAIEYQSRETDRELTLSDLHIDS
ncbi:MAG: TraR/DksA C4-type zinc finger protein [Planctomycetaceae bacterium]|nr:TraR/DksA C4-type zinc finger protein [Planctomycetaceae bacterium]